MGWLSSGWDQVFNSPVVNPLGIGTGGMGNQNWGSIGMNAPFGSGGGGGGGTPAPTGNLPLLSQTPGYQAAQDQALSRAPSPWTNLAKRQQDQLKTESIDNANATNASSVAGADSNLAATGGLSSGARERIAEGGNKSLMGLIQNANQTNLNNNMSIDTTGAQQKQSALNSFNALTGQDIANQDAAYGATNTANAIANTKTSSCFITTAMCDHFGYADDCREMQAMRNFRDNYVAKNPEIKHQVAEYYRLAKKWDADLRQIKDPAFWSYIRGQIGLAVILTDGKHGFAPDYNNNKKADRGWQAYLIYKNMVHHVGWEIKKRRFRAALSALPCAVLNLLKKLHKSEQILEVKNG